jgi:hypothetical protein
MAWCDVHQSNPATGSGWIRIPGQACDQDVLPGGFSFVHTRCPNRDGSNCNYGRRCSSVTGTNGNRGRVPYKLLRKQLRNVLKTKKQGAHDLS